MTPRLLRASSLSRFMQCTGSLCFENLPPQPTNPAAEEGTAAAEFLEMLIKHGGVPTNCAKNGHAWNDDMKFHVPLIFDEIIKRAGNRESVASEQAANWTTRSGVVIKGTCDVSYVDQNGWLNIDDLKFGYGIVEPENNWQLVAYAIGEMYRRGRAFEKIVLRIIQPRPYHEKGPDRTWVIDYATLLALKEQIELKCEALVAGDKTLVTGEGCRYCPASAVCGAAIRSFNLGVDVAVSFVQDQISDGQLSNQLTFAARALEMVKLRHDSLKALTIDRIKRGSIIPGYVTEESYGDRKWKANVNADVIKLLTGKEINQTTMLSPAQAEKLGVSKQVVKDLVDRPFLGQKLVRKDAAKLGETIFGKQGEKNASNK